MALDPKQQMIVDLCKGRRQWGEARPYLGHTSGEGKSQADEGDWAGTALLIILLPVIMMVLMFGVTLTVGISHPECSGRTDFEWKCTLIGAAFSPPEPSGAAAESP